MFDFNKNYKVTYLTGSLFDIELKCPHCRRKLSFFNINKNAVNDIHICKFCKKQISIT